MRHKNYGSFLAFTLAEILIVIGVIGIIAQVTIPTLMKNVNDTQMVAQAKVAYSTVQQIVSSYSADGGGGLTNIVNPNVTSEEAVEIISKYAKAIKKCPDGDYTGCLGTSYKYADNSGSFTYFGGASVLLKNGISFGIFPYSSDNPYYESDSACNTDFYAPDEDGSGNPVDTNGNGDYNDDWHYSGSDDQCGHLFIDLNGPKGPNQLDKDAYFLIVSPSEKLKYWDYESDIDYILFHNKLPTH